jgi:hypothetical protein
MVRVSQWKRQVKSNVSPECTCLLILLSDSLLTNTLGCYVKVDHKTRHFSRSQSLSPGMYYGTGKPWQLFKTEAM